MAQIVSQIAARVEEAIMEHEAFKENFEIIALEKGSVVTLRGKVPSKKYLQLAESIAQNIEGVTSVINQMRIETSLENEPDLLSLDDETQVPPGRSGPHARG